MATPPPNAKISDCETVLKKQAAAIRAAAATLKTSMKAGTKQVGGKTVKVPVVDAAIVKKATAQYRAACAAAGFQYEQMRKWFDPGKNAAVNDFESAGREWAKIKKLVETVADPTEFGMNALLKDMNKK
jgi:hypothetical protein